MVHLGSQSVRSILKLVIFISIDNKGSFGVANRGCRQFMPKIYKFVLFLGWNI